VSREPYASEETIELPVPAGLALEYTAELYKPAKQRRIDEIVVGGASIGHFRLLSLMTEMTPGGYPQLVATMQRIHGVERS
jgi:hypothetical protein